MFQNVLNYLSAKENFHQAFILISEQIQIKYGAFSQGYTEKLIRDLLRVHLIFFSLAGSKLVSNLNSKFFSQFLNAYTALHNNTDQIYLSDLLVP